MHLVPIAGIGVAREAAMVAGALETRGREGAQWGEGLPPSSLLGTS